MWVIGHFQTIESILKLNQSLILEHLGYGFPDY